MKEIKSRNIVLLAVTDNEIKNQIISHMITHRYNPYTTMDIVNDYFPFITTKSERMKIQRAFEKLEKGGIVKSTTLKKDYQSYKHDSWENYEVAIGDKTIQNERKIEKKEKRKPNTNKFVLSKSIKLDNTKTYSKKTIDSISYTIGKMMTDKNDIDFGESLLAVNIIIRKDTFGLQTDFIKNTVSNIGLTITNYDKNDTESYSLNLLLSLIKLKSKLNLSIVTDSSKMDLNGVRLKSILFNKNSFDIKFKNTTVTLTDINQIKSIQSYDTHQSEKEKDKQLREDIKKLKTILTEYPTEITKPITELIDGLGDTEEMFVF